MQSISVSEFHTIVLQEEQNPSVALLDVRSRDEYDEQHIPGVINIPLQELAESMDGLRCKERIYIHCLSGGRSRQAVQGLAHAGLQAELVNVDGGILAWEMAGYPTVSGTSV